MLQSIDLRGHVTTRKPEAQRRIQEGSYQSVWAKLELCNYYMSPPPPPSLPVTV